jgi:beta-lactamase class A
VAAASYVSTRAGTVLAAVYDIATGQTWRLGQGQPQAEASVVKLDVLETLLAEHGDGSTGLPATDQSLAQQMIEDSDNAAATSLWYDVGGAASIRSFNAAAGLTHTSPSLCVDCAGFPWPGWGLTTTTPTDQISLLRELVEPNALLTSAERSYALSLMENVTPSQRWGISGGVPLQATVALKNGWLPLDSAGADWQINSVGWISDRRTGYLMAVLTTGNPTEQYGIDTINELAAIVWKDMS